MNAKRKYEAKLLARLEESDEFLIARLKKEWNEAERAAKRTDLIRQVKRSAAMAAKTLLVLALVGGAFTVAAVAPNVFGAVGRIVRHRRFFDKIQFRQSTYYLKRRGYIGFKRVAEDEYVVDLTQLGKEKVIKHCFDGLRLNPMGRWDGKWRIILFDIPEQHKWAREGFREKLKLMGFYPMQKSVFVTPYPCREEIEFLMGIYNIGSYVKMITTELVESDEDLRAYFKI